MTMYPFWENNQNAIQNVNTNSYSNAQANFMPQYPQIQNHVPNAFHNYSNYGTGASNFNNSLYVDPHRQQYYPNLNYNSTINQQPTVQSHPNNVNHGSYMFYQNYGNQATSSHDIAAVKADGYGLNFSHQTVNLANNFAPISVKNENNMKNKTENMGTNYGNHKAQMLDAQQFIEADAEKDGVSEGGRENFKFWWDHEASSIDRDGGGEFGNENFENNIQDTQFSMRAGILIRKLINKENTRVNYLKKTFSKSFEPIEAGINQGNRDNWNSGVCKSMKTTFNTDVDIVSDVYLSVHLKNNFEADNYMYLTMYVDSVRIFVIPFSFLTQLSHFDNRNRYDYVEYIKVPLEMICGELNLFMLNDSKLKSVSFELSLIGYRRETSGGNTFGESTNLQPRTGRNEGLENRFAGSTGYTETSNGESSLYGSVNFGSDAELLDQSILNIVDDVRCFIVGKYINNFCKSQMANCFLRQDASKKLREAGGKYFEIATPFAMQVFQSMFINNMKHLRNLNEYDENTYIYNQNEEFIIPLQFRGGVRGFVFLGEEVSQILEISLLYNNETILQADKETMKLNVEKITSRMLFLPFDNKYNLKSCTSDSFQSFINFDPADRYTIKVKAPFLGRMIVVACTIAEMQIKNKKYFMPVDVTSNQSYFKYYVEKGRYLENRLLEESKAFCVISQDKINEGENYCVCETCGNCVVTKYLNMYFDMNYYRKCPYCRSEWTTTELCYYTNTGATTDLNLNNESFKSSLEFIWKYR